MAFFDCQSGGTLTTIRYSTSKSGANIPITTGRNGKATVCPVYGSDGGTVYIQYSDDGQSYITQYSYACNGVLSNNYDLDFTTHSYWRIYCAQTSTYWPTSYGLIYKFV